MEHPERRAISPSPPPTIPAGPSVEYQGVANPVASSIAYKSNRITAETTFSMHSLLTMHWHCTVSDSHSTAVPQGFATSCERCKELPARHGSRYCGQSCRNADAGGLAATCQECRRPIIGDPNRRFCSLQCENAFRGSLSRR